MIYLLDTHTLLWWFDDPQQLSGPARAAVADTRNEILVSAATGWEIAIKRGLGKLTAPVDLESAIRQSGFRELPITLEHALTIERLPVHHRDPFDRLLIAQAIVETATLITRDAELATYGVPILPA
ncbi:MAG: type II toxin-antitoxin system VapC family toxin [Planctomycetaceae bacterium]|nr:type II toxin-antitoxin system VapC family toxin [Planctomycetaceae bacterium]